MTLACLCRYYDFFLHQDKSGIGGRNKMFVVLVMTMNPKP